MSLIEIKAIAYAIAAVGLIFLGFRIGSTVTQDKWNLDKLAQARALTTSQDQLRQALEDRTTLQQQVASQNEKLQTANDALSSSVNDSLRHIQSTIHALTLPASVAATGGGIRAPAVSGGDSGLEQAIASVASSIGEVTSACLHDSRELQVIEDAAPKPLVTH